MQWTCIGVLLTLGWFSLWGRVTVLGRGGGPADVLAALASRSNATAPMAMARWLGTQPMSLAGSIVAQRRRGERRAARRARQARPSLIVAGSHSALGVQVLRRVFGALCARPRLSLSCEGSERDAAPQGRRHKRRTVVRFERGAARLLRAVKEREGKGRGGGRGGGGTRVVALLWDPLEQCVAEWASSTNASHGDQCRALGLDSLGPLMRAVRRKPERALVLRLSDVAGSKEVAASKWRSMFHFLGLHEANTYLASIASAAARNDRDGPLRAKVRNAAAPAWARDVVGRRTNSSLANTVRRLRRDLASF